ncbi:MAG: hypothetical protein HY894_00785 [Deltaproteobacteria bacterium]|nr:hypothetical protein [Deltaproteobacteria bacterium]
MRCPRFMASVFAVFFFLFLASVSSVILPAYASVPAMPSLSEERGTVPLKKDFAPSFKLPAGNQRLALVAPAVSTFTDWYRYPSEDRFWFPMAKDPETGVESLAYFRDALAGAMTSVSGANDNDAWTATLAYPGGTSQNWPPLKFFSAYQGMSNCFVSYTAPGLPSWYECGGTSLDIIWYAKAQCRQPGLWTMRFYYNGAEFYSGQFRVLPQIPEKTVYAQTSKVPLYNQFSYADHYDSVCRTTACTGMACDLKCAGAPNETNATIAQEGCYLTDAAMILSYHGATVTPPDLNTWLNANAGYESKYDTKKQRWTKTGHVKPDMVVKYAGSRGVAMSYDNDVSLPVDAWAGLSDNEKYLCAYGPQMGKVSSTHWAVLTGMNQARTLYAVNESKGGVAGTTTAPREIRKFSGPEYIYRDRTAIEINFYSPGELLITDPLGRRLGYDPINKAAYNEMPGLYGSDTQHDDVSGEVGHEAKELRVSKPMDGDYILQIIGTGTDSYGVTFAVSGDWNGVFESEDVGEFDGSITTGEIHSYGLNFVRAAGPALAFHGGFDGAGQRPKDVNKFLSYFSPTNSQTKLPAGTTSFPLMITYSKETIAATFKAVLNGIDVTSSFKPVPGGHETVVIPLAAGRNVIELSVDGALPARTAHDADRLVFIVQ